MLTNIQLLVALNTINFYYSNILTENAAPYHLGTAFFCYNYIVNEYLLTELYQIMLLQQQLQKQPLQKLHDAI